MDAQIMMPSLHPFASQAWILPALLGAAAGLALGLIHFVTLWWNAAWFSAGRPLAALGLQLSRFLLVVGVFVLLARTGAVPLLAGAIGFLVARRLVLARVGRVR